MEVGHEHKLLNTAHAERTKAARRVVKRTHNMASSPLGQATSGPLSIKAPHMDERARTLERGNPLNAADAEHAKPARCVVKRPRNVPSSEGTNSLLHAALAVHTKPAPRVVKRARIVQHSASERTQSGSDAAPAPVSGKPAPTDREVVRVEKSSAEWRARPACGVNRAPSSSKPSGRNATPWVCIRFPVLSLCSLSSRFSVCSLSVLCLFSLTPC